MFPLVKAFLLVPWSFLREGWSLPGGVKSVTFLPVRGASAPRQFFKPTRQKKLNSCIYSRLPGSLQQAIFCPTPANLVQNLL